MNRILSVVVCLSLLFVHQLQCVPGQDPVFRIGINYRLLQCSGQPV